jgi:hypothetical protein
MFGIAPARFVPVKLNGPPGSSVVIFWMATKGIAGLTMLVNVHVIWALGRTLTAGIVSTLVTSVPKVPTGFPEAAAFPSTQFADVIVKFMATVSVRVTAVPVVMTRMGVVVVG